MKCQVRGTRAVADKVVRPSGFGVGWDDEDRVRDNGIGVQAEIRDRLFQYTEFTVTIPHVAAPVLA